MSWTVPTGCYYAVIEDDPQQHFVYYSAGKTVPTEHAPNNPYVDERDLQNYVLIDFTNGYIYAAVNYCTITIKSNNTFTAAYDGLVYGSYHNNIFASSEALAQYHLTLSGVAFNFGNGSGMLNKSAFLHSSRSYKMRFTFAGRSITSANIPTGVDSMWHAFDGCTSLTTASNIPSGVEDMGYCFQGCTSLTTAPTISSSVIYLNHCFKDCTSLTTAPTITTPSAITKMGYCFQGCTSLTTAPTIPSNVERMGYCFQGCTSLTTAPTIPSSVAYLNQCFKDCTSLGGAVTINASPSDITEVFTNTVNDIVLLGSGGSNATIASQYANVYVWELSAIITAQRQENSPTTVDVSVDVTRFNTGTLSSLVLSKDGTTQTVTWNDPTLSVSSIPTTFTTTLLSIAEGDTPLISVVATDAYGSADAVSVRIPISFYTIDVQAGGKEVAFGAIADDDLTSHPNGLFRCNMDAQFNEAVHAQANKTYIDSTIDPTQIPAEGITDRFQIVDVNGDRVASYHAQQLSSSGTIGAGFNANRIVNGTNIANGIMFNISSNGTRTVYLNDPQVFIDALGIADYITAQGSSGNWRYRKWKSGKIEAWGTWSGSVACTTASQPYGGYRSASITAASIPSGIFTTTPKYVVATKNGSNAFRLMNFTATSATATQFYISCASSETNTVSLSIYAMQV